MRARRWGPALGTTSTCRQGTRNEAPTRCSTGCMADTAARAAISTRPRSSTPLSATSAYRPSSSSTSTVGPTASTRTRMTANTWPRRPSSRSSSPTSNAPAVRSEAGRDAPSSACRWAGSARSSWRSSTRTCSPPWSRSRRRSCLRRTSPAGTVPFSRRCSAGTPSATRPTTPSAGCAGTLRESAAGASLPRRWRQRGAVGPVPSWHARLN
jgi:hypothetical protein